MNRVYEAFGKRKRIIIEDNIDYRAANKLIFCKEEIGINDFVMVGSIEKETLDTKLDINWYLNGLLPEKYKTEDITILEPLEEHYGKKLIKINEVDTRFDGKIELSNNAIVLLSVKLYEELMKENKYREILKKMNVVLYEGEKDLALKMLFFDKKYAYMDINQDGYVLDKERHLDIIDYNKYMIVLRDEIKELIESGKIVDLKH